ncbi:MAG TPA: hypothetical protein VKE42_05795 [Candidatus Cybelea sp.]|nr:hypothetical protein [Candidatus Cybelea sp.]
MTSPEIASHLGQRDILANYFEAHPFVVVTHAELVTLVGENYRSRIADCRRALSMNIENVPVRKADGTRGYGSYRYRPGALGREADTFVPGNPETGTLFDLWPSGWQSSKGTRA